MNNVEIIKQAYEDFAQGNIPGVLGAFDENIQWLGAKGLPMHEGDGIVLGPQNILQGVFARIPEFFDELKIDVQDVFGVDNKVVVESYFVGTWKASGKAFKANSVNVWQLENGKVVRCFESIDTGEMMSN